MELRAGRECGLRGRGPKRLPGEAWPQPRTLGLRPLEELAEVVLRRLEVRLKEWGPAGPTGDKGHSGEEEVSVTPGPNCFQPGLRSSSRQANRSLSVPSGVTRITPGPQGTRGGKRGSTGAPGRNLVF